MKKVVGIVFSDLHLNLWNKFNQENKRTLDGFRVLFLIKSLCLKYGCPAIFCGDLFHKPEFIENELLSKTIEVFDELDWDKWKMYLISGNHDMSKSNGLNSHSPSWVNTLSKKYNFLENIDFTSVVVGDNYVLHGIPYIDHNIGLNEYVRNLPLMKGRKDLDIPNILLLHTDYPGAKDTDGVEVGSVENLNINVLSRFDLVLAGHIHKPQRLSKKVFMVGAPIQQRRTDKGCDLGYWKLYSDMSMKFVPLEGFPKFIDVDNSDDINDDGNFYTVVSKPISLEVTQENHITRNLSKKRLVSRYLRKSGIKDPKKKSVLLEIIKETDHD